MEILVGVNKSLKTVEFEVFIVFFQFLEKYILMTRTFYVLVECLKKVYFAIYIN